MVVGVSHADLTATLPTNRPSTRSAAGAFVASGTPTDKGTLLPSGAATVLVIQGSRVTFRGVTVGSSVATPSTPSVV